MQRIARRPLAVLTALVLSACGDDSATRPSGQDAGAGEAGPGGRPSDAAIRTGGSGGTAASGGSGPMSGGATTSSGDGGPRDSGNAPDGVAPRDASLEGAVLRDAGIVGDGSPTIPDGASADTAQRGGDSSPNAADAGAACAGRCAPPAPTDWTGPLLVRNYQTAQEPPACEAPFAGHVDDYFTGFRARPASCECECRVAASACAIEVWADDSACTIGGNRSFAITPRECAPVPDTGFFIAAPRNEQVTCSAPQMTEVLPTPDFSAGFRACERTNTTSGCTGDLECLPEVTDSGVCIVRSGNRQCPAGPYTERRVAHRNFSDTRACSACACSGSPTCQGTIEFRNGAGNCPATQIGTLVADDMQNCTNTSLSPTHAFFNATTWGGTCEASGGELTGSARATEPHTLCCLP